MTVSTGRNTVKNLITALLEMPMDSEVEICIKDKDAKLSFVKPSMVYDEDNGVVVISN